MILQASASPRPPFIELWHCGRCDVMFDLASADQTGDVVACPRCGCKNLGYVGGPASPATEVIEVIDEPQNNAPATVPAGGSPPATSAGELVELLTPELTRFEAEAAAAHERLTAANQEVVQAQQQYSNAQNTYARLKDFLAQIQQPLPARSGRQR